MIVPCSLVIELYHIYLIYLAKKFKRLNLADMDKYFDAHRHISDEPPRANTIYNATTESDWAAVIARTGTDTFGAIGIHPWFVNTATPGWDARMVEILKQNPDLMIGEIGLDKNHDDMELQCAIFQRQTEIACALGRRAQIHCLGAWDRMGAILARAGALRAPLFHGWTGAVEIMDAMTRKYDAYFSFSGNIADPRHVRARTCVAHAPETRILVESDDMSPATIYDAIAAIAEIRGTTPEHVAEITYQNAMGMIKDGQTAKNTCTDW